VETQAELEKARQEGFSLFQGYYFCRPVLMQNRAVPANRLVHLELLQVLHGEFLDTRRISNLVKRDASLTYRLLRLVNSPMYGMGTVIRSIQSALVLIGDAMFRRVAILAIASELGTAHSMELLRMAFLRGRFCELAAPLWGGDATEQYLLGIVSLMPAMLQVPMERIADVMPLRGEVRQALLGEDNRVRTVLRWLEDYELGRWAHCDALAGAAQLEVAELTRIYEEAVLWAEANLSLAAATVTGRIAVRKP
jgi:EAL and modified HD-GYP domain-containing signal transduction protein